MRRWFILPLLLFPSLAFAQTHPCDLTPPTSLTITAGSVTPTLGWCHADDATGYAVYVDGTKSALTAVTKSATANTGGLFYFSVATGIPVLGVHTYEMTATNAVGESAKSSPFVLTVNPAPTVPSSPVKVRVG
jgi:hypothetical protein